MEMIYVTCFWELWEDLLLHKKKQGKPRKTHPPKLTSLSKTGHGAHCSINWPGCHF